MKNPRSLDDMVADIARDTMKASALPKIVNHIRDYHLSLDKRLNGDVAANDCIRKIEAELGLEWFPGAELARRNTP